MSYPRSSGHLSPRTRIPNFNVILIAALTLATIPFIDFELAATVLIFGAFVAFMGVNLATIREYYFRRRNGEPSIVADLLVPGLGFLICLAIWLSLPIPAKIGGGAWLLIGLVFDGYKVAGLSCSACADRFQRQINRVRPLLLPPR